MIFALQLKEMRSDAKGTGKYSIPEEFLEAFFIKQGYAPNFREFRSMPRQLIEKILLLLDMDSLVEKHNEKELKRKQNGLNWQAH